MSDIPILTQVEVLDFIDKVKDKKLKAFGHIFKGHEWVDKVIHDVNDYRLLVAICDCGRINIKVAKKLSKKIMSIIDE